MDTGTLLRESPELLARAFDLLDDGITDHVRDMDVLVDFPEVISVVRFHFYTGTGYEVIFSNACEMVDFEAAVQIVSRANIIRCEPHGYNGSGYPQARALYWELRTAFKQQ